MRLLCFQFRARKISPDILLLMFKAGESLVVFQILRLVFSELPTCNWSESRVSVC